jgi:hypothetical protein
MPLGDLFKLSKLTIKAFKKAERRERIDGKSVFEVQYNPETLTLHHESVFQEGQANGSTSGDPKFAHSRSKRLDVNLVIDGTNVGHVGFEQLRHVPTAAEQIADFLAVCYQTHSATHEPAYLTLTWGKDVLGDTFDCRLQSADVKYTSFGRDGSALHAEITAQFVEALEPSKRAAKDKKESPDLSHRRLVRSGDTLPQLCLEVYGSAHHYVRVAEVNALDTFRTLQPGAELVFPPLAPSRRG